MVVVRTTLEAKPIYRGKRPAPRSLIACLTVALVLQGLAAQGWACPFCTAVAQTFGEEIKSVDAAVIAKMVEEPKEADSGEYVDLPVGKFEIVEVLKGAETVAVGDTIETYYYGSKFDATFVIMGTDPQDLIWSAPTAMTDRGIEYVRTVSRMTPEQPRLPFFINYLEDDDEVLAQDAYDEFAKAPYEDVIALKEIMDREKIVAWIQDTEQVPASRRSLYVTMLGICGQPEDLAMLERFMRSDEREDKVGLNAIVACYLTLRGEPGMELIHELFLSNAEAEYQDTYAAISALRFHGSETDVLSKEAVLGGFRALLDRPDLADLVIPDLARLEDWSVLPRLATLFREADEESNWVRVPIVNYVRACPLPAATETLAELRELDPEAVKRASMFMPFASKKPSAVAAAENADSEEEATVPPTAAGEPGTADEAYAELQPSVPPEVDATESPLVIHDSPTIPSRFIFLAGAGGLALVVIVGLLLVRGNPATP